MFERFTDRARRVLVLAQEEARSLNHAFIGPEHILLGLIHEGDGLAAQALTSFGVTLEAARQAVGKAVAGEPGPGEPAGSPPFTATAKRALERALRHSLELRSPEIRPEHLLLGLLDVDGVVPEVLVGLACPPEEARRVLLGLVGLADPARAPTVPSAEGLALAAPPGRARGTWGRAPWARSPWGTTMPGRAGEAPTCSLCDRDLWEVAHYVAAGVVAVCDVCISAARSAVDGAPAERRRLVLPPRTYGEDPGGAAVGAVVDAVTAAFGGPAGTSGERGADGVDDDLAPLLRKAQARYPVEADGIRVSRVRFLSPDVAEVRFGATLAGGTEHGFDGTVRRRGDRWTVTRETVLRVLVRAGIPLPD
ncbi:MAG: Clp protease N-terminal domain-containing protein [Acidimicrobiales bacterium]